MPNSLMDMFQPRSLADNQPIGFGDAIAQNRQSLIGLGMGLLTPRSLAQGAPVSSAWSNALGGYEQGAQADSATAYRQAQVQHTKRQEAFQRSQAARAQSNFERQFARSDPANAATDFTRAARDLGLTPGTPEHTQFAKEFYAPKTEQPKIEFKEDENGNMVAFRVDPRNPQNPITQIPLPGQTGTAAAKPDPFAPGATSQPVYGQDGNFSAAPAAPIGTAPAPRGITLPSGEVVTPPPGLSKKGREAWATDVAKTAADMQIGKMTEAQAKYSIYATGMEIAQRELQGLEGAGKSPGTSTEGKGLGGLPWGVGAFFQSNEYQNYRNAKDAWLNAKLRAESGATINPDEFARDDRIYFPQPGEGPQQVEAKKKLREQITNNMKRAGGPGYQSPPTVPAVTPTAPTATATPGPSSARRSGGLPPPPPGFNIVQ